MLASLIVLLAIGLFLDRSSVGYSEGSFGSIPVRPLVRGTDLRSAMETDALSDIVDSIADLTRGGWWNGQYAPVHYQLKWARVTGSVTTISRRGWPINWYRRTQRAFYEDPVSQAGLQPVFTDPAARPINEHTTVGYAGAVGPRTGWSWDWATIFYCPAPEQTGGEFVTTRFSLVGVLLPIVGGVLAWWLTAAIRGLVFRDSKYSHRSRRWCSVAGVLVCLLLGFPAVFATHSETRLSTESSPGQLSTDQKSFFYRHTDAVPFDLAALGSEPDGSANADTREVFEQALGLPQPSGEPRDRGDPQADLPDLDPVLVVAMTRESGFQRRGGTRLAFSEHLPLFALIRGIRYQHPDFAIEGDPHTVKPTGFRVRYHELNLNLYWPDRHTDQTINLAVYFEPLLFTLTTLIVIVWLLELPWWLWAWRQQRRRSRSGCCVSCGYGPLEANPT